MPAYQTFPYRTGSSNSLEKLACLALPPLAGKSFLDVGCNEGFFCGYAFFEGARKVLGIDRNASFLAAARRFFPECVFLEQDWEDLDPTQKFDVILCASALHYAVDQEKLLHSLAGMLAPDGLLVLELGIAPGDEAQWVEVRRSIDVRRFPTRRLLESILNGYAWKDMGQSPQQIGDPLPRFVYHIRRKKPCIFLLLQESGSGKTSIRREIFGAHAAIVGDMLIAQIAAGQIACAEPLRACAARSFNPAQISHAVRRICAAGLLPEYLALALSRAEGRTAVYDGYIPSEYHGIVEAYCAAHGYLPVLLRWPAPHALGNCGAHARQEARKYQMYLAAAMKKNR
ncbi:class I SAM-dependent methyltransferase [Desulfovibrio sp. ZJ200]|uniref:class I SAM-dependent methyltransferase n=1 Tax=Desulfovibrio sp. ZJ200 TaxID=2709792 RepID=UPI0013EADB78|nr:class I SAM-dependent methyltransferase [Desulfovibrio sp. ZJ200]